MDSHRIDHLFNVAAAFGDAILWAYGKKHGDLTPETEAALAAVPDDTEETMDSCKIWFIHMWNVFAADMIRRYEIDRAAHYMRNSSLSAEDPESFGTLQAPALAQICAFKIDNKLY